MSNFKFRKIVRATSAGCFEFRGDFSVSSGFLRVAFRIVLEAHVGFFGLSVRDGDELVVLGREDGDLFAVADVEVFSDHAVALEQGDGCL